MARIPYTYNSYPNCPRATEYSKERERTAVALTRLIAPLSIGGVIAFLACTFSLFSKGNWGDFFSSVLIVSLAALYDAYIFELRNNNTECQLKIILLEESSRNSEDCQTQIKTLKKENRKENMAFLKIYFKYFFLGMFVTISVIGIIQGFVLADGGVLTLSFLAFLVLGFLFFYALPIGKEYFNKFFKKTARVKDYFNKLFQKKELPPNPSTTSHTLDEKLFCRKCGTQIPTDSLYCSKCGSKVEGL